MPSKLWDRLIAWGTPREHREAALGDATESLVYGVTASDPWILGLGCVVLGGAAVVASALPALRAVQVSPVLALRAE